MSRSFDYGYTCGSIDSALSDLKIFLKDELKDFAESIISSYEESKSDSEVDPLEDLDYYVDRIYDISSEACEDVRKENQDMRNAAEEQIADITSDYDILESERDWLQDENDTLKERIEELENQLYESN